MKCEAVVVVDDLTEEVAAAVLEPHFDAVRDAFASFEPEPGRPLHELAKVKFVIDPAIHNTDRHFAATREDGKLMLFAPEFVGLPVETMVAILAHEFGHAADFTYRSRWRTGLTGPGAAQWVTEAERSSGWPEMRLGDVGEAVARWQQFLRREQFGVVNITQRFDAATEAKTRAFQRAYRLPVDGQVAGATLELALSLGLPSERKRWGRWQRAWSERGTTQVEWAADGIAETVTGRRIGYSGNCMLQSFDRGAERPAWLR